MNKNPLVPENRLLGVKNELYSRIARLSPGIALDPGDAGEAYAWTLLFERWPDLISASPMDPEDAFYNRYFWFKRFAVLKQEREGYDAGLEQQIFMLLEQSDFEIDWTMIEQLDAGAARTGS